jgi:hypothetical protein
MEGQSKNRRHTGHTIFDGTTPREVSRESVSGYLPHAQTFGRIASEIRIRCVGTEIGRYDDERSRRNLPLNAIAMHFGGISPEREAAAPKFGPLVEGDEVSECVPKLGSNGCTV